MIKRNLSNIIMDRLTALGEGTIITNREFLDIGTRDAVDQSLSRLAKRGAIRRLRPGLYELPRQSSKLGTLSPDPFALATALSNKSQARLLPSGAYAANLLGLSTQVPARIVYYTDGADKQITVGKQIVELRHAGPRRMAGAGKPSGLVIQALKYIGMQNVNEDTIAKIKAVLSDADRASLLRDLSLAADWQRQILVQIADHNG